MAVEAPVVQRIALVAGGTGMTGRALLKLLLTGGDYARIHAVSRRPVPLDHPRLANRILPLEQMQARLTGIRVNDAFCCLGAPQARAGTLAELRPVDLELTLAFARTARGLGASRLVVLSAAGADRNAKSDFLRVKGELEAALKELRYPALDILAPGSVPADSHADSHADSQWAASAAADDASASEVAMATVDDARRRSGRSGLCMGGSP